MDKEEELKTALAGQVLSSWLPYGSGRKIVFFIFIVIGTYGLLGYGSGYLTIAYLGACFMSPRLVGEVAYRLVRIFG
jgi:hypothetical protein